MGENRTISVWRWEDAPEEYRALSQHGGDEDWLVFVPKSLRGEYFGWMAVGSAFGVCDVERYEISDPTAVAEARKRIAEYGTLAYIARVLGVIRAALRRIEEVLK